MVRFTAQPHGDVNPLAERSLLTADDLARWHGLPVGWVEATPELVGRCGQDDQFILAMLDSGRAQADFRFGTRVCHHDLGADDMGLFAPGAHADLSHWRCEDVRRIMIRIDRDDLNDETLVEGLFEAPPQTTVAFRDPGLAAVLRAMVVEVAQGCPHGSLYAESLSLGVAMHLQRRSRTVAARERGKLSVVQIQRLQELVRVRIAQSVSIGEMANAVGLSRTQLMRVFKLSLGCTPYQYVLQTRMNLARERVLQGRYSLAEVAQWAGFASQSHMTSLFLRHFRCTPGELRRSGQLGTPVSSIAPR